MWGDRCEGEWKGSCPLNTIFSDISGLRQIECVSRAEMIGKTLRYVGQLKSKNCHSGQIIISWYVHTTSGLPVLARSQQALGSVSAVSHAHLEWVTGSLSCRAAGLKAVHGVTLINKFIFDPSSCQNTLRSSDWFRDYRHTVLPCFLT